MTQLRLQSTKVPWCAFQEDWLRQNRPETDDKLFDLNIADYQKTQRRIDT